VEDLSDDNPRNASRLTGPLADALARDRDVFNARFAFARSQRRNLDSHAFSRHLRENMRPIVEAVAALQPGRVDAVVQVLFELSLDGVGRNLLGPETRVFYLNELWREHLPKLARFVCEDPRMLVSALTYAMRALGKKKADRARTWIARLVEIAQSCPQACSEIVTLLDVGKVLAWRSGMAHYRESALDVWRGLPDALRYEALILSPEDEPALLDKMTRPGLDALDAAFENPWFHPSKHSPAEFFAQNMSARAYSIRTLGGFVGFGYEFVAPPRVMALDGRIFAFDGDSYFGLYADSFGATLQPVGPRSPAIHRPMDPTDRAREALIIQWLRRRHPTFNASLSQVTTPTTCALTLPHRHCIFLVV